MNNRVHLGQHRSLNAYINLQENPLPAAVPRTAQSPRTFKNLPISKARAGKSMEMLQARVRQSAET